MFNLADDGVQLLRRGCTVFSDATVQFPPSLLFIQSGRGVQFEATYSIEGNKSQPYPSEVLTMSEVYGQPALCNYYCTKECEIGAKYVPEVRLDTNLSQIVLEILNSLNSLQKGKERLIEISVDGRIEDSEIPDFIAIQKELDNISMTVNALKLWAEKKLSEGKINRELYDTLYDE